MKAENKSSLEISKLNKILRLLTNAIEKEVSKENFDNALYLTSLKSSILYQSNICYTDEYLENILKKAGSFAKLNVLSQEELDSDTLVFYDGFGANSRGLIQIYLKALCKIKKVVYVTYEEHAEQIPDLKDIIETHNGVIRYIKRNDSYLEMIRQLNAVVLDSKPAYFFFYSFPYDVVATPLMCAYENIIKRFQINLTDHAFWLGAGCIDVCINFRDYGAKISCQYRKIAAEKNVVIPFYSLVHEEREFQGYPIELKSGQKVVFSGGALYKTLGDGNRYYKIVDKILEAHPNVVFWYAGSGNDTELIKILKKYPARAFHTEERSDLFQVLEHSDVYLSTYPMSGGIMFQYAAMAGVVPVTLKFDITSDDLLLDQAEIGIEFETESALYEEIDRLLEDEEYAASRGELMRKSVIKAEDFEMMVASLFNNKMISNQNKYNERIDTEYFRQWCLNNLPKDEVYVALADKRKYQLAFKYYPLETIIGVSYILGRKIKKS